jgi:DNA-binding winged helix-turn-helix (wHTH) protein
MSSLLRQLAAPRRLRFKEFEVDLQTGELLKSGKRIPIQRQPFNILAVLLAHAGELVSRGELKDELFADGVNVDFDHSVNRSVSKLRTALGDCIEKPEIIETLPGRGYRFIAPVSANFQSPALSHTADSYRLPMPSRGALPLHSPFYIEREVDAMAQLAIQAEDSVVLLKGARQTGKTSLLARVFARLRAKGDRTAVTDMQKLALESIGDIDAFLRALARSLSESMELDAKVDATWDARRSASSNFERFIRKALSSRGERLVWGIDEADRILVRSYGAEFFALLRAWHNERALDPGSYWHRLTVVIAYATEAHLFITDANQSPFNVGTKFELLDLTCDQILELNARYGHPTGEAGVSELHALLGGHPYLIQRAMFELFTRECSPRELSQIAADEDGPFAEHLRHLLLTLNRRPELLGSVRLMLNSSGTMPTDHFYRLRAFGILTGDGARTAIPRCKLYRDYLCRHLT